VTTPRTVAFHTLGCKLNFAETSSARRQFEQGGYAVVPFDAEADVYVINTCSVTENADRECRKYVRQAHRRNIQSRIVVMGCYAQLKPKEIASIEGVDLVLGAAEKFRILDYLDALDGPDPSAGIRAGEIHLADTFHPAHSQGDRTRSFLKVQDGCDYKCTFCTIPQARGQSRSARIPDIIAQADAIGRSGIREIVLTGVNIGDFGNGTQVIEGTRPKKEAMFIDLVRALDDVASVRRFRISSIEPNLCTDEIIRFVAGSERFMPHFHMPLQSGNNDILRRMRRRYLRELYADRVSTIRTEMPDACIGVDVITGFPGETDAHFEDTFDFLAGLDISYIHAFTYSERDNTPAAEMHGVVPVQERRDRSRRLRELSEEKKKAHALRHLGETRSVLFEKGTEDHLLSGFTDNYIRVVAPASGLAVNMLMPVRLGQPQEIHGEHFMTAQPVDKK
jgi:threonylcarbamoyladenosine tRNA methylthiotransferase MtaB